MKKDPRFTNQHGNGSTDVLQFGDGNFLRGFADWIIDMLNERSAFNSRVHVVAPLRRGRHLADEQEGRFHVVQRGILNGAPVDEIRRVTCIAGFVNPYEEYERFLALADDPSIRFVISNTTEAGISFNNLDSRADIPADSFPAKVTQLLFRRYNTFGGDVTKGWIFLPCELIEANAATLRNMISQYAELWNLPAAFSTWINDSCLFRNTLVDRIVTGYPGDDATEIFERIGYRDKKLVVAEPYHLWVIESGTSKDEVLPVRNSGLNIKFVPDLTPYRTSKVRILNGAHTAMTLIGYLKGIRTVQEAVEDPWMADYLTEMLTREIIPTIPLPAADMKDYAAQVFERFRNPFIRHELKSIALNSVSKFRARLLPTILDHYKTTGNIPPLLITAFAALIVFYRGEWKGEALPVNDHPDAVAALQRCWLSDDKPELDQLLANESLWGTRLDNITGLETQLLNTVQGIITLY